MINILEYVRSKGYKPKPIGSLWRMFCPYPDHKEKQPSFTIYPKHNSYYCWGCRRGGSLATLMRVFGDQVPQELIDDTKQHVAEMKLAAMSEKQRLLKAQGILLKIRRAHKTSTNHAHLNRHAQRLSRIIEEFQFK
jgi:hypothetical protein